MAITRRNQRADRTLRSDMTTMKYPFFPLSTGDRKPREFEHKGFALTMLTSTGFATIHDKDFLIYAMSQFETGSQPTNNETWHVEVGMKQLLHGIGRPWGGNSARLAIESLERLFGTSAIVRDTTGTSKMIERGIHLLAFEVVKRPGRKRCVEDSLLRLSIHSWFAKAIMGRNVLAVPREYFRIKAALDKRLYELARVSASREDRKWTMATLHARVGTQATLRRFRQQVAAAVERSALLDYTLSFDRPTDMVTFGKRKAWRGLSLVADGCRQRGAVSPV